MEKEEKWLRRRLGMITASELKELTSASGKIIDGNLSYIRAKRFERKRGFAHQAQARTMEIGNQQEPMAVAWLRANVTSDIVYSKELAEIPFWIAKDCPLGASPDAYTPFEETVFEIKTNVGASTIEYFCDECTSYAEKKITVWKDHGEQILGQFISNDNVKNVWLLRYTYQDDDIMSDTDSPLAPWRGIIFKFARNDYEVSIKKMKERVRLFDAMISSGINPSDFKKGTWYLDRNGKLNKYD